MSTTKPSVRKVFYPQVGKPIWRVLINGKEYWRWQWQDAVRVLNHLIKKQSRQRINAMMCDPNEQRAFDAGCMPCCGGVNFHASWCIEQDAEESVEEETE